MLLYAPDAFTLETAVADEIALPASVRSERERGVGAESEKPKSSALALLRRRCSS